MELELYASVAQLAEQLICNQQVVGSSPSAGSIEVQPIDLPRRHQKTLAAEWWAELEGGFPSGQRGQTVNLMAQPSQVRILHPPFDR